MVVDAKRIKRQIQAESELHIRFGDGKIYAFLLREIFNNDAQLTRAFLLSDDGGYTEEQVDRLQAEKQTHQKQYLNKQKLLTGLQAF